MLLSNYEKVQLEELRIGLIKQLDRVILSPEATITLDEITNNIVIDVQGFVWAESLQRPVINYPNSWWDAFKIKFFPKWALRRWPAKCTDIVVDVKAVYPNLRLVSQHDTTYVFQMTQRETE